MYIPEKMKKAISKNFYDKEISVVDIPTTHDEEGGIVYATPVVLSTFKGNANYNNCGKVQEEYGLDYKIDITITTSKDTVISINNTIEYGGRYYTVSDVFERDSHVMLVARIYQPVR